MKLTRERVWQEAARLKREVDDFMTKLEPARSNLGPDLSAMVAELEQSVIYANQFLSSNTMDFHEAEVGLAQLRALKARIASANHGDENAPNQ